MDVRECLLKKSHELTAQEAQFLKEVNDPTIRPNLLGRLQELGLLPEFLVAESGTT